MQVVVAETVGKPSMVDNYRMLIHIFFSAWLNVHGALWHRQRSVSIEMKLLFKFNLYQSEITLEKIRILAICKALSQNKNRQCGNTGWRAVKKARRTLEKSARRSVQKVYGLALCGLDAAVFYMEQGCLRFCLAQ